MYVCMYVIFSCVCTYVLAMFLHLHAHIVLEILDTVNNKTYTEENVRDLLGFYSR